MSRLGRLRGMDAVAAKQDERYRALLAMLPAVVEKCGSQAVANIAHALSKLGERCEGGPVLDAVEARADWLVKKGTHQTISNTAWAFAMLNRDSPKLFSAIDARADWLVKESDPQSISNTAWAFATLSRDSPKLFSAIDSRAHWLVKEGKPQNIANTAWAFATLGRDAPKLLSAIDARAGWLLKEGNPQNIANTAWAFAELGIDAPNFWTCLERRGEAFAAQANAQAICNTAWALAVAGRAGTNSGQLRVLWDKAMAAGDVALNDENIKQLVQVGLHAKGDGVKLQSAPNALKQKMLEALANTDQRSSEFEDRVAHHLTDLGVEFKREFPPFGAEFSGMLAVDIALTASDGTKIAIESDGPSHYLLGPSGKGSGRENGRTVAKRRLLERSGWRVVNLSWFEDRRLIKEGGEEAQLKQWTEEAVLKQWIESAIK
jgi:hypothetical protein